MKASICPLCGQQVSYGFVSGGSMEAELERQVIEIFSEIYPHWRLEDGACLNCTELFTAYRETFARARPFWQPQTAREEGVEETTPCTLCGYEVPSEDFLFHRRIEEVLLDRIEGQPPGVLRHKKLSSHRMAEVARIVAASVTENPASVEETS